MAVDLLSNIVFSGFLIISAGVTLALQAGCNASLARHTSRTFSPLWSFVSGTIFTLIFFAVDVTRLGTPLPNQQQLLSAPGYAWIGKLLVAQTGPMAWPQKTHEHF
ncbi:hypothetical protein BX666DRAFT_1052417 [Dichotomocladium elegans]|nr:hypothetical protein BX666DRAFT_1052417 [Dichotomocladium elegans]